MLACAQHVLACAQFVPSCSAFAQSQNPVLSRCHFPSETLHKSGDIWLGNIKSEKSEILEFRGSWNYMIVRCHFALTFFHTIGDIWLQPPKITKFLKQKMLVLAHAQPFTNPKIQLWESVIFLHQLFTKFVISDSKLSNSKNNWILGILCSNFHTVSLPCTTSSRNW